MVCTLLKMFMSDPRHQLVNPGMSRKKLFLAGGTFVLERFSLDQKRKIQGNPEIPDVFPAGKSLISEITGFPADGEITQ
jgi:hypothetical protein